MEASSVPKNEFEKVQEENSKLKGILTQTVNNSLTRFTEVFFKCNDPTNNCIQEEMLVELQSSVRKEEDSFVQKIRDLETRLEEYECNGAGDSTAQV